MFGKFFKNSSKSHSSDLPWIALENNKQLDTIKEDSKTKLQLIFKHSTRCGISRMVMRQFEKDYPFSEDEVDLYYLNVLTHRTESNEVARVFGIQHESPQFIVIENGKVKVSASHGAINEIALDKLL